MNCLNQFIIEGKISDEPKCGALPNGLPLTTYTLCTVRYEKMDDGRIEEEKTYVPVKYYGSHPALSKGRGIRIVGKIAQEEWKNNGKSYSRLVIIPEHIEFKPSVKEN